MWTEDVWIALAGAIAPRENQAIIKLFEALRGNIAEREAGVAITHH